MRLSGWVLLCLVILGITAAGVVLRNWTWQATENIHYPLDISNGLFWGKQVLREGRKQSPSQAQGSGWAVLYRGYLAFYDHSRIKGDTTHIMDYPPLRLFIMTWWVKDAGNGNPDANIQVFEKAGPLLMLNLACEFLSAIATFLLIRTWLARSTIFSGRRIMICSLAAATGAWLEPSLILDAHAWPQWDSWPLPFYLFAALSMMNGRWLLCGCLLAVGGMLKGQLLIVAPFFVLVPLWSGQWRYALHVLAGFAVANALIVFPWLVRTPASLCGVICAAVACTALCILCWKKKKEQTAGPGAASKPVKQIEPAFWCCAILSFAIFFTSWVDGGDFAWLRVGFFQGVERFQGLITPTVWCNLPALLDKAGWKYDNAWKITAAGFYINITLQNALRSFYFATLALSAWGASRHLRNRDPCLLFSLAMPWLLMFALLPQMHSRYLLWGATVSALSLAISWRLGLLHFLLSAAASCMILDKMVMQKFSQRPPSFHFLNTIEPCGAYVVLACVTIYLVDSLWRSRRTTQS